MCVCYIKSEHINSHGIIQVVKLNFIKAASHTENHDTLRHGISCWTCETKQKPLMCDIPKYKMCTTWTQFYYKNCTIALKMFAVDIIML